MEKNHRQRRAAAREVFQNQLCQNMVEEFPVEEMIQSSSNSLPPSPKKKKRKVMQETPAIAEQVTSEELQQEREGLAIRETGWWIWRTVVVPPNAYVVHTRRGCSDPITIGLGKSFRYRARTDSYLVVPAAMQTIGIVAQGISKEKQGVSILAYVQWLISNFAVAYQRLDFSDPKNPMGVVNAQLREQAEAAIKDKISTMSVEEILTDKAPIIEELTQRMKTVAEGDLTEGGIGGLGLQIVTVQIKEAFVSSQQLWEFLQAPFRNDREQEARLSRLRIEEEIKQQELTNQKSIDSSEAQTQADIAKFRAEKESESSAVVVRERMQRELLTNEEARKRIELNESTRLAEQKSQQKIEEEESKQKYALELLNLQNQQEVDMERTRLDAKRQIEQKQLSLDVKMKELDLEEQLAIEEHKKKLLTLERQGEVGKREGEMAKGKLLHRLGLEEIEHEHALKDRDEEFKQNQTHEEEQYRVQNAQQEVALEHRKIEQEILNGISDNDLQRRFLEILPELASSMPEIKELKSLQISSNPGEGGGFDTFSQFLIKLMGAAQTMGLVKEAKDPKIFPETEMDEY